jgi:hypothetical protein
MSRAVPLLLVFLASCAAASSLEAVTATADGVVFGYSGDRAADAARRAALYCANLGRGASLRQVTQESGHSVATFECRP